MSKKVLIITYYWPPSGGGGVQRWLKFAKYLPEFGWEPIVFTPENPDFDIKDESLLKDVSDDLEVIKFPIWEPYGVYKKLSGKKAVDQGEVSGKGRLSVFKKLSVWIRGNFFIPDPKVFWVKPASEFLLSYIRSSNIQHIITTGPPHSMHLIGSRLKKRIPSLNWVADFRDPWSELDLFETYRMNTSTKKKHLRLENDVLLAATQVLTVSEHWKVDFQRLGAKQLAVVTNGYDEKDIPSVSAFSSEKFRISHIGMLNEFRNPQNLWLALREIAMETPGFLVDLELNFIGIGNDSVLNRLKQDEVLGEKLMVQGAIPHDLVFEEYAKSAVLLLIINQSRNAEGHNPGKLFEYLAMKRPILCIGPEEGDAATILSKTNTGVTAAPSNTKSIKASILTLYKSWKEGKGISPKGVEEYTRRNLTKKLVSEVLEK